MIINEMLVTRGEIDVWKDKKVNERTNARYNEILYYGLGTDEGNECDAET